MLLHHDGFNFFGIVSDFNQQNLVWKKKYNLFFCRDRPASKLNFTTQFKKIKKSLIQILIRCAGHWSNNPIEKHSRLSIILFFFSIIYQYGLSFFLSFFLKAINPLRKFVKVTVNYKVSYLKRKLRKKSSGQPQAFSLCDGYFPPPTFRRAVRKKLQS